MVYDLIYGSGPPHGRSIAFTHIESPVNATQTCNFSTTGWSKKGSPLLAAILKNVLEVINLSVYILRKFRLFYVSGEEIVEKDARMSLIRLFERI